LQSILSHHCDVKVYFATLSAKRDNFYQPLAVNFPCTDPSFC